MKVTVILKDFTEEFFTGFGESIVGLNNISDSEKFLKLKNLAAEKRVSMKIGSGQFRDAVDFNSMLRLPCSFEFTIEPRKGYKLATFNIVKA
jgi:hypothetical protein